MQWDEIKSVLQNIQYKDGWNLGCSRSIFPDRRITMTVEFEAKCSQDRTPTLISPKFILSPEQYQQANEKDLLGWVRRKLHWLEIHESDEWFRYRGGQIFHPHGWGALSFCRCPNCYGDKALTD